MIWNVLHCWAATFLIFFSMSTCQGAIVEAFDMLGYGSLGFYIQSSVYLFFGLSSLFTIGLLEALGSKVVLTLSTLTYFQWTSLLVLPTLFAPTEVTVGIVSVVCVLSAALSGIGSSMFWIGQGKYIADWSNDTNKGRNFGLGFGFYSLSTIFGNMFGAYLMKWYSKVIFFTLLGTISFSAFIVMIFLKDVRPKQISEVILLDQEIEGDLLESHNKDNQLQHKKVLFSNLWKDAVEGFKSLSSVKVIKLNIYVLLSSMIFSIFAAFMVKMIANSITDENQKLPIALTWMVYWGIGQVFGSFFIGKVIDYYDNRTGALIAISITIFCIGFMMYIHSLEHYTDVWMFVAFTVGMWRTATYTSISCIASFEFTNQVQALAMTKFIQALAAGCIIFSISYIKEPEQKQEQRIFLCVVLTFWLASIYWWYTFPYLQRKVEEGNKNIDVSSEMSIVKH